MKEGLVLQYYYLFQSRVTQFCNPCHGILHYIQKGMRLKFKLDLSYNLKLLNQTIHLVSGARITAYHTSYAYESSSINK